MNNEPKKEEPSRQTGTPPTDEIITSNPNLPVKRVKLTVEGVNQADIDAVLKRWQQMKKRLKADILFLGARLAKMRNDMKARGDRSWTRFVDRNLPFNPKSANVFIRAWEDRNSELALADWDAFMRMLWNPNKAMQLKAPYQREADDDQSGGGDGLSDSHERDREEDQLLGDKGMPGLDYFKRLIGLLDRQFLFNNAITLSEKRKFMSALNAWSANWLEKHK